MKKTKKNILLGVFFGVILLVVILMSVAFFRYKSDISYSRDDKTVFRMTVASGDNISSVAEKLKSNDLISSKFSFELYAKLNKKTNIKAGNYELTKAMTIPDILNRLNEGQKIKTFSVMFLPGGTVSMAKKTLISVGYSENEVKEALSMDYSNEFPQLFKNKPKDADLEGFLYGETHTFENGTSAKDIVRRFLKDFEKVVIDLKLEEKFKKQGLTLYEGITLASIVQRETLADFEDQKMVAGVFFNRIKSGMNLGSDVTYQYIADKLGVERRVDLDSPYNLRRYSGLTPTPISTPSVNALRAVAEPSTHNYIFFLSGDDDKTYFGITEKEHNENIKKHCQKKCLII